MIPATLPICVFFTLYALAAAGFFVAFDHLAGKEKGLKDPRVRLAALIVLSAFWPVMAVLMVFDFVKGRA